MGSGNSKRPLGWSSPRENSRACIAPPLGHPPRRGGGLGPGLVIVPQDSAGGGLRVLYVQRRCSVFYSALWGFWGLGERSSARSRVSVYATASAPPPPPPATRRMMHACGQTRATHRLPAPSAQPRGQSKSSMGLGMRPAAISSNAII